MDNIYYVYGLIDPRTNLPFYIGKGKDKRYESHFKETHTTTENIHKYNKIKFFLENGYDVPVVKYYDSLSEEEAFTLEEELIRKYGRANIDENGILTNICLSATPPSNRGKRHSPETRAKMSGPNPKKALFGEKNGFFGKSHSEETKRLLAEKAKKQWLGVKKTDEHRENMRKSFDENRRHQLSKKRREMNKNLSETHRNAIREKNKAAGYAKTKQAISEKFEEYKVAIQLLECCTPVSEVAVKSGLSYYQVWSISKRMEYFNAIIKDCENEHR